MNRSLLPIRLSFILICIFFSIVYAMTVNPENTFTSVVMGLSSGLLLGCGVVAIDYFVSQKVNLRILNTLLIGLFLGYLLGELLLTILNSAQQLSPPKLLPQVSGIVKAAIFLVSLYIGLAFTARASNEFHLSIPFVKFKASSSLKKDTVIDWSILLDSRIIDIASSGLLDDQLIVPRFMLNELYLLLESPDEATKNKAKRCLDVFKKLESIPSLALRYSDLDFLDLKDSASKTLQLARQLEANIITADVAKLQLYAIEGIRIINIHMLSNVLKPMVTGENIAIKIQRYGKEPRQGVGYLDDGTMVVVNGGAEFLGEMIKAQVLSVKHTSSGRMIFCNAADELILDEQAFASSGDAGQKSYFTL